MLSPWSTQPTATISTGRLRAFVGVFLSVKDSLSTLSTGIINTAITVLTYIHIKTTGWENDYYSSILNLNEEEK